MPDHDKRSRLIEAAAALLDAADGRQLKTVSLNKALFYFDLACLRDFGETFTDSPYIALTQGPVVAKYQNRLLKPLATQGIAEQRQEGDARPVLLKRLPEVGRMTAGMQQLARRVSKWCCAKTAASVSDFSHENPGWVIAREAERHSGGAKQVIDLYIAMQQIIDFDPWMDEPLDPSRLTVYREADVPGGIRW